MGAPHRVSAPMGVSLPSRVSPLQGRPQSRLLPPEGCHHTTVSPPQGFPTPGVSPPRGVPAQRVFPSQSCTPTPGVSLHQGAPTTGMSPPQSVPAPRVTPAQGVPTQRVSPPHCVPHPVGLPKAFLQIDFYWTELVNEPKSIWAQFYFAAASSKRAKTWTLVGEYIHWTRASRGSSLTRKEAKVQPNAAAASKKVMKKAIKATTTMKAMKAK